ncbi:hypothetical protein SYNPS1DRAFT_29424 [Syncephalis pseudoplumigaleata]|uniref:Uncharacterized protein n=1 Tax=Syncephalis pseudoplumigaleata TaxID=1712513 RepID=A0A4P9YXS2_9FUNG|nr:hypothetical protein SYNPS1DRAFT_29424 [Syncephalis pseudoplumigaleata]|eukprot:RKP24824.1 hypothetical protein SYNPS1DRAFT_29424 [Syncephalis pseudoplumigaleata]
MSSKLVKQALSLLADDAAGSGAKRNHGSKQKKEGKAQVESSRQRISGKQGIKKERDRHKRRCVAGNLERAAYLHRTADPLDAIRNEDKEQQQRLSENIAYLKKSSLVRVQEARLRQRILARLNEEAAAKQRKRQRHRQHQAQREADASDEEWAAMDA